MGAPQVKNEVAEDPLLPRHRLVDVMIDDPFDQVEQTEADQERPTNNPACRLPGAGKRAVRSASAKEAGQ
jgi:hypothetical protein